MRGAGTAHSRLDVGMECGWLMISTTSSNRGKLIFRGMERSALLMFFFDEARTVGPDLGLVW